MKHKLVLAIPVFLLLSSPTFASGFRIPEISIAGTGMANALVADSDTAGALPYNPAAMAFHERRTVIAGLMNIQPTVSVNPEGRTRTESEGSTNLHAPNFYYMAPTSSGLSWGLGINAPFGLETKWPDETFPQFAAGADILEPEHSKMEMLNINPNLAYRLGTNTSAALGLDLYWVKNLIFNTQAIDIKGDGRDWGWNLALLHRMDQWSFGLSYRSSVKVDLEGSVDGTAVGSTKSDATASMEFPSLLQIGARYTVNKAWKVEFDIERTGWSSFDVVKIDHASPGLPNPILNTNEWDDAMAYRLGTSYQLSPQTQLRFGYAKDFSPQNGGLFSARVPDNDRQALSAGVAYKMDRLTIEASYMYVWINEQSVNESTAFLSGGNTDPNGTTAYNGTYNAHAHLLGVGVTATF